MARQVHNNLNGLYPALDRKKVAEPYVVDGKNFIVDLDGPKSAFGYKQPWHEFEDSSFMQSFPVGTDVFYFARDILENYVQVSKLNWLQQQILPIERFDATPSRPKLNLPWSHALVGTYHYFANRTFGVLRYDRINENWEDVTATIGIDNIFFITESDGRLIALAEGLVAWSAIEDGMDFTTSLSTGAGFQGLSIIGSLEQDSDYLGLQKISNGFLSFTSKGVLRSQIIDSISPFRHITGEASEVPLTPWCVTKISSTDVVILTRHGLFISKTGIFEPWQPLMSEYFKQTLIPPLQSLDSGFISIYYSRARDEFYVAFAASQVANNYTVTYALYLVRDQWGLCNRTHKGFVFLDTDASGDDFRQAYIAIGGTLNWLDDSSVPLVVEPQNANGVYVPVKTEYPVFGLEAVYVLSTAVRMHGFSYAQFPEVAGFYEEAGTQDCFKTEEVGATLSDVVLSNPSGIHKLTDISITGTGKVLSTFADVPLPSPATAHTTTLTFTLNDPVGVVALENGIAAGSVARVVYDFGTDTFTDEWNCTGELVELGDGVYELKAHWSALAALVKTVVIWAGSNTDATTTASIFVRGISIVEDANPLVELMRSVDITDTSNWSLSFATLTEDVQIAVLRTDVTENAEICIIGAVAQGPTQLPMDSYIEVGLFRFTDEETNDQLSAITNLAISCLDATEDSGSTLDDWLLDYESDILVDWLAITPDEYEDWGLELATGSDYTETIKGSLDGYKTFEDQEIAPELVLLDGKTKFMTCENQGIFQTLRLDASQVGESFHLKTIELNGFVAGRL